MNLNQYQADRTEIVDLYDEWLGLDLHLSLSKGKIIVRQSKHPWLKGRKSKHIKNIEQELLFQEHVLSWAELILELGKKESLKRMRDLFLPLGIVPKEALRTFKFACTYFVHDA